MYKNCNYSLYNMWLVFELFSARRSIPEPKRLQCVHGGLGAADVLPLLPVVVEQHQAGGPVHGSVLRPSHLLRGFGVRHTLRRPQSRCPHMRHDEQPSVAQTAQDHRWGETHVQCSTRLISYIRIGRFLTI